jgi:hypothetical protein
MLNYRSKAISMVAATTAFLCSYAEARIEVPVGAIDLQRVHPAADRSALLIRTHVPRKKEGLTSENWLAVMVALTSLAGASAGVRYNRQRKTHLIQVNRPAAR